MVKYAAVQDIGTETTTENVKWKRINDPAELTIEGGPKNNRNNFFKMFY